MTHSIGLTPKRSDRFRKNGCSPAGGNDYCYQAAIVFGAKYEVPKERKEIALDAKILEKYVGQYQIPPSITISVTLENGKLLGQLGGQGKFALLAATETVFFSKDVNAQITFNKDAQGLVTGLTLSQGGGNTPAQKIK